MTKYDEMVADKRDQYEGKFDASDLDPQFITYFDSGERIRVETPMENGEVMSRTGTVGVTTGWRPAFLLMHRSNASGSIDLLLPIDNHRIAAVKRGESYEETGG